MSTIKPSFDRAYQDFLRDIKIQVVQSRIEAAYEKVKAYQDSRNDS
ncbi:hypothetical protein [Coleofasciculus sp.]